MRNRARLAVILVLAILAGAAMASEIDVSQPEYLTDNGAYDRNPSVIFDGSEYWLFYTKGDDVSTLGVRGTGYDPDGDAYVVYYKKAAAISGLVSAAEVKLDLSETNRPTGFDQRVVSATYFGGNVYAFVSSGQSGTDRGLYYYTFNGSTWSGPTTLIADATARGGHVNVASDGLRVYIVWESSDGSSDCYTWNGTTLSSKIDISNGNMPKITVMQSKLAVLFVVNIEDGTGDIEVFSAVGSATPLFNPYSTAITGGGYYDPCIFNDGTDLYVVSAPWVPTDRQYLVQTKFNVATSTWSTPRTISYGGYGTTEWWEFWPCGYFDGGQAHVFFTTETGGGPSFSDAEIAHIQLDWDLSHNHFFFIQNAIDNASSGDAIAIAEGDYEEQLEIDKDLSLTGSGRDLTTVQSPVSLSASFATGNVNYPVVYVHDAASVAISALAIDGLGRGNTNYRFVGLAYYNAGGSVDDVHVTGVRDTPFSGSQHGISLYAIIDNGGPYTMTVENTDIDDMQKGGMVFSGTGLDATITDCTIIGVGQTGVTAQNGIQVGTGSTCTITGCEVDGMWYTGTSWSASGILLYYPGPDAVLSGNTVNGSQGALNAYFADNLTLEDNTFDANDFAFIWGGDGVSVTGNGFTGNAQALYIADATNLTSSDNSFDANDYAIIIDGLADDIGFTQNDILNCTEAGVVVVPYGTDEPVNVHLNENNISGNAVGIDNTTSNMVDAVANWWGDATGPAEATKSGSAGKFNRPLATSLSDGDIVEIPFKEERTRRNLVVEEALKAGTGDAVSALVDYSPWWGADYMSDPHTSPWDWYVDPSNSSTIQEGVDAAQTGDNVHATEGTYEEQVIIAKNLSLSGAGKETTTIQSPVDLTAYFTSGADNYPIVYVHDADVDLAGFTIDGMGRGNSNYRFVGIGFWNAGGSVAECYITGITDTPFSGSQHGNGIYAYNNTGGPYTIDVTDVDVDDFQKNGMTLLGENLTATVTGCTIQGIGPTTITAQNGIQLGYGSGGTISDCAIDGIAYDIDGGWIASGILLYQGTTVDINGATSITNSQANIVYQETDGSVVGVTITTSGVIYEEGISIRDYAYTKDLAATLSFAPISPMKEDYAVPGGEKGAPTNVTITDATLTGVDEPESYGIAAWALGDDVTVTVEDCDIHNWEIGLVAYESGSAVDLSAYHTKIADNAMGYWTNAVVMQDAEYNWWGDISGPYHVTGNPLASGNEVSDNVDYEPWCNEDFTVCDYGQSPQITLNYPANGIVIPDPFAELSATVTDESPMEVRIYGNHETDPTDLIFVGENVGGQGLPADVLYDWTAQVLNPEATNTVGLWHFDESTGTEVLDESEYGNTGMLVNFDHPAWTADGRFGYAIEFDGTDDYISVLDLDNSLDVDPATGALTMEAWVYPHQIGGDTYRAFISKRDSAIATAVNYALYFNNTDGALSFYNGTFPAGFYISSIIPSVNQWSYLAVSLDAAEGVMRFYLNGVAMDSIAGTSFGPMHNGDLTIGTSKTPSANRDFDGKIDEVRLTKRVLSDAEIAANYALNAGTFYWKVTASDGAHTSVSDVWHFTANDTILPTVEVLSPEPGQTWDHMPTLEIAFGDNAGLDRAYYQFGGCGGDWTEFWSYNSDAFDTTITWQIPDMPNGIYAVYFKVVDDAGNMNENMCTYGWDFTLLTIPPEITSTAVTTGATGSSYVYDVEATGAPEPRFALLSTITGMTIDTVTGIINWLPMTAGNYGVSVEAHNAVGADTQSFALAIVDTLPPEVILVSPENGSTIIDFSAEMMATVSDHSSMTVYVYGDRTPNAADLLYVAQDVTGTDITFDWSAAVFEPDPPYTRGLWHFDEGTAAAIQDESFHHNDGFLRGDPAWLVDGRFGYALDFDGDGDYVAILDDNSLDIDSAAGNITIEAWIYPRSSGSLENRAILGKRNPSSAEQNYSLWLSATSDRIGFRGTEFGSGGLKSSSIPVYWDSWSYVAMTLSGTDHQAIFYVIGPGGFLVDTVSDVYFGAANADSLMIGMDGGASSAFDGYIDEVRITGRILSYNEIAVNAGLTAGNYYWKVLAIDAYGNSTLSPINVFYIQTYVCGDANGDGKVNVADAVYIVQYIFQDGPPPIPERAGDANGDGSVNVGDAVHLINYIFKDGPPPIC